MARDAHNAVHETTAAADEPAALENAAGQLPYDHPVEALPADSEAPPVASPARPRRGSGRVLLRSAVSVVGTAAVVVGAAIGIFYWRLGNGPLSLPFITQTVHQAIAAKLPPGYRLSLDDVAIERRPEGLIAMIRGVTVREHDVVIASAPRVYAGFDLTSLLLGDVTARSIVVEGAAATVNVSIDGRFTLQAGVDTTAPPAGGALSLAAVLNGFDTMIASIGSIDRVELRDAALAVHDQAIGHDIIHRGIDLTVRRTAAAGGLSVALAAAGGSINATTEGGDGEPRSIDVKASNIGVTELVAALAPGVEQPSVKASFDVLARATINPDGSVEMAEVSVTSAGGSWNVEPKEPPFVFDGAQISLSWNKTAGTVQVAQAMVRSGEGILDFKGKVVPPSDATGPVWTYDLQAPDVLLAGRREERPPLKLDRIDLAGRYDPATNRLSLDKGEVLGPTVAIDFSGAVGFGGKTPAIDLTAKAKTLSAVALTRIWPVFSIPEAKIWLEDHIKGGVADGATLKLAIPQGALASVNGKTPPLPDEALSGSVPMSKGIVQIVDTLPPISDAEGRVDFSGRRLAVSIDSASVETGDTGTLALADGTYKINDFAQKPPSQSAVFGVKGPAQAVAKLMTMPPLAEAAKGMDIKPDEVNGIADLKVKLDLPLIDHPRPDDIKYAITGGVQEMQIDHVAGSSLQNGTMKLSLEPGLMLLTGKGVFDGLPANFDLRKAEGQEPQMALSVILDEATRKRKGFDFGDALTGPVQADIHPVADPRDPRYDVDIDLAAVRIKDLLPGWQKPAGAPGKLSFSWDPADKGGGTLDKLTLDSGPVSLRGTVTLGPDNKLRKAMMDRISLSPGDDFQGVFEPLGNGWKVFVRGNRLDARPLLSMLQKRAKGGSASTSVNADIRLSQVVGFNDETLADLGLMLDSKGTTIRKLDLSSRLVNGQLTASLGNEGRDGNLVTVQSTNAGAVMRFLDLYTRLRGGALGARFSPVIDNMRGRLVMRSFSVENETALGQYRSTLKNAGKLSSYAPGSGDSAQFTRLELAFTRTASRIGILDSVVWGPDVGVSLSGALDYGTDRVNLTGTFVPAYALNNIFSKIPLIGGLLSGGQYGGLFAINFKVSGRVNAPVLTVNPLSAIAPGFLRKIFEFQKQTN
ncbi:DUF3971 domain-containing protein [Labrys sp. La1]|uniref:YhdP family protein n=1 Tax=Labrys sp. La1 TaxID=3404917 RepID=UPI003EC09B3A